MAGGNHPKSSASSSLRKTRWESSSTTTTTTNNNKNNNNTIPPDPNPKPPTKPNPSPKPNNNPNPSPAQAHPPGPPPPPPAYGFHMLDRRTIILADGSVRSYFALPPDYRDFTPPPPLPPPPRPPMDPTAARFLPGPDFPGQRFPMSPEGFRDNWNSVGEKRKFGNGEEKDDFLRQMQRHQQHFMNYGPPNGFPVGPGPGPGPGTSSPFRREMGEEIRAAKYMRVGGESLIHNKHLEVDQNALKKAFLHFVKLINENPAQRKTYLEHGKQGGRLQCVACSRSSKDFPDMHGLIMHTYNSDNAELRVDHLGLHKALCVLLGWNYSKAPDNSKAYQFLPADEAAANHDDMIMWPPLVIIHNTITGKGKDGRMEGLGNKAMDSKIRDLGFAGGKSKSMYGRDGHLGITLVKFAGDQSGLKDAVRLAEYFEKDNHGRKGWARIQPLTLGKDDEKNPNLVKVDERTGEKKRILYGYLGTAADLDKLDFDTRKKVTIESQREYKSSR